MLGRNQRGPQFRLHVKRANRDKRDDDSELNENHDIVRRGRLFDPDCQQERHRKDSYQSREVHDPHVHAAIWGRDRYARGRSQLGRKDDPDIVQKADQIARPSDRHSRRRQAILKNK